MPKTWILQANPKLYDIDAALKARPVIYWRIPQRATEIEAGDYALIWRSGAESGFVGSGVFLTEPNRYDISKDDDPFVRPGFPQAKNDEYAPLRVWPATHVPKSQVAGALPEHRIITAPMGTVFSLDTDELTKLEPLLTAQGYDLAHDAESDFSPLPVLPDAEIESKPPAVSPASAKQTGALFLLSSTPARPIEITIEGDALSLLLIEREALGTLSDETWDAAGVYLLIGPPTEDDAKLSVYVGRAQGLRARIRTGHASKVWNRCLLIQRKSDQPFNSSDIAWLERRLIDVFLEAPQIELLNKQIPPDEDVLEYKAEILERTATAALGVLGVLGAYAV